MTILQDKDTFKERVRQWAEKLDVDFQSLAVRPMRNKWASCSSNGSLNFDAGLLALDHRLSDYVIVHELLNFRTPNHGKLWKSLMRVHLGDYENSEEELRRIAHGKSL